MHARVPMGTGNEMVVTVSQPAKVDDGNAPDDAVGGWLLFSVGMIRAHRTPYGLCQQRQYASRSMDRQFMRTDLWEPKCPDGFDATTILDPNRINTCFY